MCNSGIPLLLLSITPLLVFILASTSKSFIFYKGPSLGPQPIFSLKSVYAGFRWTMSLLMSWSRPPDSPPPLTQRLRRVVPTCCVMGAYLEQGAGGEGQAGGATSPCTALQRSLSGAKVLSGHEVGLAGGLGWLCHHFAQLLAGGVCKGMYPV